MAVGFCSIFSRACGAAIVLDYLSPRPGLSYIGSERPGLPGLGFLSAASAAVEACRVACKRCYIASRTSLSCRLSRVWWKACRGGLVYGNTSAGALLLLVFQAGSLGWSMASTGRDRLEAVMGSASIVVGGEGLEGSKYFYRVYRWLSPSYLARLSADGLPDIMSDTYLYSLPSFTELVCKAGLYDNVLGDLCRLFQYSLGYAYSVLVEEAPRQGLRGAVREATMLVVEEYGDFLSKRKGYRVPGSAADIVVNALARLVYEAFRDRILIPL